MLMRTLLLAFIAALVVVAPPANAASPDPVRAAIAAGADRLVALQNADGGWFFTVGDANCGAGPGVSCPNTFGVTALGLVEAYRVTHSASHLAAAKKAADALVAKHNAALPCDGNPGTSADRPFTVDADFLVDISHLGRVGNATAKKEYRDTAKAWFACVMADFPSAAARADNRINGRIAQGLNNLGAWDASLDIRAALEVGERAYAEAEALQVIAREADWDVADPQCPDCNLLSKGLFLEATYVLQGNATIRDARNRWKADLLATQNANGSWTDDTQNTAYIVMGLTKTSQGGGTKAAIDDAVEFLLAQQQPNGGFIVGVGSTDEVTEVDSEVLQALVAK